MEMGSMKRVLAIAAVVLVVGVLVMVALRHRAAGARDADAPTLATVQRGDVRRTVTADGTLRALTTVEVKSDVSGKVELLAVDVGDRVKKGDLIAKIDPTDSETAYTQALAQLRSSQAQLAQAQAQAQAQPEMTSSSIAQAEAAYAARVKDLERLQASTQPRARADAKAALEKATAALQAAEQDLARLETATQPEARSQAWSALCQATAALEGARQDLARLEQAQHPQARTSAQADLDKARSALSVAEKEVERARQLNAKGYVSRSALDAAENAYESAKATFASAQERAETVAADQAAERRSAELRVQQAQAALDAAQKRWDTVDADQTAEVRAAEARVAQARADLAAAQRRWNTIDADQASELAAARAQAQQALNALRNARANAVQDRIKRAAVSDSMAQLTRNQAQVDQTRTTLSYTIITAPRDGVILKRYVEQGTIVTSGRQSLMGEGANIVQLGDLSQMYVDVSVDETDLADVRLGQKVEVTVDSVEDKTFAGSVTRIDPQATTTANVTTVKVEIRVLEQDERLLPGLTATCVFQVGERRNVLCLPSRAVREQDHETFVLVPDPAGPRRAPVRVGLKGDDATEIISGLKEGDQVILPELGAPTSSGFPGPPGGPLGPMGGGPPPGPPPG
jgi:HlyD family secretion protein